MSRPLVGITAWRRHLDTYLGSESLQTLATFYTDAVINAGMTPIIFPNGQDPSQAARLVSLVDGVVLSGGDDIDPHSYGAERTTSASGISGEVDSFEIAVVAAAREQNKPLLAICRGLQLLNVALGGTITQDITRAGTAHEPFPDDADPDEVNQRRHAVHFESGSRIAEMYDTEELKVNTLHHQGIEALAAGLIVEGKADDGLIEAARCDGSWWSIGVQWHPERMDTELQNPLFAAFREAIEAG
jgi:putative glutamine amidotransferase